MNALLERLVDDAGLFPPTALPPADAVRRHRADLAAGHPMHSHRLLVPVSRLAAVRAELRPGDRIAVGLIADGTPADDPAARLRDAAAVIADDPRLTLALAEAPVRLFGTGAADAVRAVLDALRATDVPVFLEPATPAGADDLLAALPRTGARVTGAKLRCGGVRADLFPDPGTTARFLTACARAGVPFKATAGLHRAVRHHDPATGFTHHGYLNLLLATATALDRPDPDAVRTDLETTQPGALADRIGALPDGRAVRALFVSYGSCSTATPVTEAATVLDPVRKDRTR
ncbi:hypothetical protein ABZ439_14670 [Streptomyces sp. NPDC005840]|uniref:hypothetical protein n=1 Tax=Streptomyces sp. NPDC005840 TaxID=3157072 RepID=UPI0033E5E242